MRVLGVDPGLERVGWGVVQREGSRLTCVCHGLILTPRVASADRLLQIHRELTEAISAHAPTCMAVERLFFAKNQTTAMEVARAAGVILLAGAASGLAVQEYSPPEIKQAVVGYGGAEKRQVGFMVQRILGLPEPPRPDDVADALAIAITHALRA